MVLEPWVIVPPAIRKFVVCWACCSTCYRVAIGPPINIYFYARDVYTSAWGGCIGSPTLARDKVISKFISGCKPYLQAGFVGLN